MDSLPSTLIEKEILGRLDLESLCSVACVSKALCFSVSQVLLSLSSFHLLPSISPDWHIVNSIVKRCKSLTSVSLGCFHLNEQSIRLLLGPNLHQLNLFDCSLLSHTIFVSIADHCPNLRVLTLELTNHFPMVTFDMHLYGLLHSCLHLESLCVKIRGRDINPRAFNFVSIFPKTIKILKLEPVLAKNAIQLVNELWVDRDTLDTRNLSTAISPPSSVSRLQSLSLVVDVISDGLLMAIANCLPLLIELDLEDRPNQEPLPQHDLTNTGLQSLCSCSHLTSLSLIRNRKSRQVSFKSVNDMSMFLLSEGCKGLESVRLCGFSKVSDAGFASILNSCKRLKKFEVRNSSFLSDLAFHGFTGALSGLVEVRLLSCSLITSETVKQLTSSRNLEVLDFGGCRSIADSSLKSISCLPRLTTLILSGSDITDDGLSVLGQGSLPIGRLSLRGCGRVTDEGVSLLLHGCGTIGQRLSSLDLGYMPGISDKSICTVATAGRGITDLCIRCCFSVTDSSLEALAKRTFREGYKLLRRLDLFGCTGLSADSLNWLKRGSSVHGLHWLGVGETRIAWQGSSRTLTEIQEERPWLVLCLDGCEMGCQDGWQFHRR